MKSMEEMLKAAQQAAETIQKQMSESQTKLDGIEVEGRAGGGLVTIRASAKGRIIGVNIDDSLLKAEEKGILEDLIAAAFNDARARPMKWPVRKWPGCSPAWGCRRASSCRGCEGRPARQLARRFDLRAALDYR